MPFDDRILFFVTGENSPTATIVVLTKATSTILKVVSMTARSPITGFSFNTIPFNNLGKKFFVPGKISKEIG